MIASGLVESDRERPGFFSCPQSGADFAGRFSRRETPHAPQRNASGAVAAGVGYSQFFAAKISCQVKFGVSAAMGNTQRRPLRVRPKLSAAASRRTARGLSGGKISTFNAVERKVPPAQTDNYKRPPMARSRKPAQNALTPPEPRQEKSTGNDSKPHSQPPQSPRWFALSACDAAWWQRLLSRRVKILPTCDCGCGPKRGCQYPEPPRLEELAGDGFIYGIHLECTIAPPMPGRDFHQLCRSIWREGQHTPILTDQAGYLLDGRYRLAACHVLKVVPSIQRVSYFWRSSAYDPAKGLKRLERYGFDLVERLQVGEELLPIFREVKWLGSQTRTGRPPRLSQLPRTPRASEPPIPLMALVPAGRSTDVLAGMLGLGRQTLERYLALPTDLKSAVIDRRQNVHDATLELRRRTQSQLVGSTPPKRPR
jgi:hypothetical protein